MWQKMLQVGSGSSKSDEFISGTFTLAQKNEKKFDVPTNSFALIYLTSGKYYAYWVLDGTTLTLSSGNATGTHVTYSNGTLTCGNGSSGDLAYVVMIGDKDKFPSL